MDTRYERRFDYIRNVGRVSSRSNPALKQSAIKTAQAILRTLQGRDEENIIIRAVELATRCIKKDTDFAKPFLAHGQRPMLTFKWQVPPTTPARHSVERLRGFSDTPLHPDVVAEALVNVLIVRGIAPASQTQVFQILKQRVAQEQGFGARLRQYLRQWAQANEESR